MTAKKKIKSPLTMRDMLLAVYAKQKSHGASFDLILADLANIKSDTHQWIKEIHDRIDTLKPVVVAFDRVLHEKETQTKQIETLRRQLAEANDFMARPTSTNYTTDNFPYYYFPDRNGLCVRCGESIEDHSPVFHICRPIGRPKAQHDTHWHKWERIPGSRNDGKWRWGCACGMEQQLMPGVNPT